MADKGYPTGETRTVPDTEMTGDEFTYVPRDDRGNLTTEPFTKVDEAWYHPITAQGI